MITTTPVHYSFNVTSMAISMERKLSFATIVGVTTLLAVITIVSVITLMLVHGSCRFKGEMNSSSDE